MPRRADFFFNAMWLVAAISLLVTRTLRLYARRGDRWAHKLGVSRGGHIEHTYTHTHKYTAHFFEKTQK